jgi:hypothetical protein
MRPTILRQSVTQSRFKPICTKKHIRVTRRFERRDYISRTCGDPIGSYPRRRIHSTQRAPRLNDFPTHNCPLARGPPTDPTPMTIPSPSLIAITPHKKFPPQFQRRPSFQPGASSSNHHHRRQRRRHRHADNVGTHHHPTHPMRPHPPPKTIGESPRIYTDDRLGGGRSSPPPPPSGCVIAPIVPHRGTPPASNMCTSLTPGF